MVTYDKTEIRNCVEAKIAMIEDGGKNSVPEASEDRPVAKGNTRPLTDIVKSLVEPVAFGFENAIRATNNAKR